MRLGFYSRGGKVLLYSRKPRSARLPGRKCYLSTLITQQDRRPGFERNGSATVPRLHPPLAHFYDEHQSNHDGRDKPRPLAKGQAHYLRFPQTGETTFASASGTRILELPIV